MQKDPENDTSPFADVIFHEQLLKYHNIYCKNALSISKVFATSCQKVSNSRNIPKIPEYTLNYLQNT